MPFAPSSSCRVASCPAPTVRGAYCREHSPERQRPSAARRGYSSASGWPEIRLAWLSLHPWCEEKGCRALATDVHHKVRLQDGGTHDDDNLESRCKPCHSRETAREDAGISRRKS